ncbi:MAG: acetyl-CoA C-acyltransferase [Candidatus Lokiarchaeota archaeon]|nr:acetyl-CoA C-acyltransferase [Candidatus Lokiarchaeota archaeon]
MIKNLNEVWLVDYARTAFSRSRPGSPERDVFGELRGDEIAGKLIREFMNNNLASKNIKAEDLDQVITGTALPVHENWTYGGKLPTFLGNLPVNISTYSVEKQCGSAGQAMASGIMEIITGYSNTVLCCGFEHMTRVSMNVQFNNHLMVNTKLAKKRSEWYRGDVDIVTTTNMLQTAQKLYEQNIDTSAEVSKEEMDKLGVRSHNLTIQNRNWLKKEIVPIEGYEEGNPEISKIIDYDVAARPSTLENVASLKRLSRPFYLKKNIEGKDIGGKQGYIEREGTNEGVITAGNSSPLNAGATACVLMNAEEAKKRGIEPMARIISMGWAGVDPTVMGRGPVPASEMALKHANLKADDMEYWEINEAFCIVALNCMKHFNIPEEKVNVMGGATAIGHPLGASMIRLPGTLARILKDKKARFGCANACVGGGQGIAFILENLDA